MKSSSSILSLPILVGLILTLYACGNNQSHNHNDEAGHHDHSEMDHSANDKANEQTKIKQNKDRSLSLLIDQYLSTKDALVQDDSEAAANAGKELVMAISALDVSSYKEENQALISSATTAIKEHAEQIVKLGIKDQREHFNDLTVVMIDLLVITGTDRSLYEQYCPMYNEGDGGSWLSESKEIRNPLFGSRMPSCGKVIKEFQLP